jgi:hypothetical protein
MKYELSIQSTKYEVRNIKYEIRTMGTQLCYLTKNAGYAIPVFRQYQLVLRTSYFVLLTSNFPFRTC